MKGKNIFTLYEYDEFERLIKLRVNVSSKAEQTKIRNKMRDIGFDGSDFGIVGMTIDKLRHLRAIGQIQVIENRDANISHSESLVPKETHPTDSKQQKSVHEWVENSIFHCVSSLSKENVPDIPGLYCIRLLKSCTLPDSFEQYRQERKNILYIGLASKSLRVRMWEQELHHKKPTTFFRSLGTILEYEPEPLKNKSKNFRFSDFDTQEIIKWIERNVEECWICMPKEELDNLETELIERYTPVINLDKNPKALSELRTLRKLCLSIAKRSFG